MTKLRQINSPPWSRPARGDDGHRHAMQVLHTETNSASLSLVDAEQSTYRQLEPGREMIGMRNLATAAPVLLGRHGDQSVCKENHSHCWPTCLNRDDGNQPRLSHAQSRGSYRSQYRCGSSKFETVEPCVFSRAQEPLVPDIIPGLSSQREIGVAELASAVNDTYR